MAFHGIFLMSAFCASMKLKPRLHPEDEGKVYNSLPGGMSLEVRCANIILIQEIAESYPEDYLTRIQGVTLQR